MQYILHSTTMYVDSKQIHINFFIFCKFYSNYIILNVNRLMRRYLMQLQRHQRRRKRRKLHRFWILCSSVIALEAWVVTLVLHKQISVLLLSIFNLRKRLMCNSVWFSSEVLNFSRTELHCLEEAPLYF